MTLTGILKSKNFKDFRDLLTTNFPTPKFKSNELIKAEPRTKDHMLVGTAYDYLFRFNLERLYKKKVFAGMWTAESALPYFKRKSNGFLVSGDLINSHGDKMTHKELREYFETRKKRDEMQRERVPEKFTKCKDVYKQFIQSKLRDKNQLIESTLFLARLDSVYRVGESMKEHINFLPEDSLNIEDLRQIESICNFKIFKPKKKIILNPTFGNNYIGADGDIIIDDTLIEIKVTKELRLTRPHFNQVLGYYLLYLINGVKGHKDIKLNNVGIYFARHNVLWTIKIKDLGGNDLFQKVANFLKKKVKKAYH